MTKPIIDISEHQLPSLINYDKLAAAISGVIIRIQYGSNYIDKHYKTHIAEFKKRNVPIAVYAWVRGSSNADMQVEATDFYNRTIAQIDPTFWWLDVEEKTMSNMRSGIESYRSKLASLTKKPIGVYVANHLYAAFNLDTSKFKAVWIPTYGANNGTYTGSNPTATNDYDLHQYTSNGRLSGYSGALDLNRIVRHDLAYFFCSNAGNTSNGSTSKPSPSKPTSSKLAVDGYWGTATTKRLQQVLGTTVDGVISNQYKQKYNQNIPSAKFNNTLIGSNVVKALQKKLGVAQDGLLGQATIKALQRKLGTTQDGVISSPSQAVKKLQQNLNAGKVF